jgi:hypothetical protein
MSRHLPLPQILGSTASGQSTLAPQRSPGSGWCCCHTPGPRQLIPDPINAAQVAHDSEVVMEHGRKRWLGVVAAATVLAGGLASIFHRDNATTQQSSGRCSGACPCGTI